MVLSCQHIPCAELHGCNVSCCRIFRRRVRCDRSLSCTQYCRGVGWTHLSSKLLQLSYLDDLQPYYCNKYSFRDTRCNKCVSELCYKSLSNVCVSNTDPGMTLKHRDYGPFGIRAHADCRTRPLGKAIGYYSLLISNSSPFLLYRWRTQGTSSLNQMMTHLSDDT